MCYDLSGKGAPAKAPFRCCWVQVWPGWAARSCWWSWIPVCAASTFIAGVYGRTVYDIEDVLCGRCEPAKAIVPSPLYAGLSVISAPYEGGEVAAVPLGRLLQAVRPYFDFILLDTAAGWVHRLQRPPQWQTVPCWC